MDPYEQSRPALQAARSLSELIPELKQRVQQAQQEAEQLAEMAQAKANYLAGIEREMARSGNEPGRCGVPSTFWQSAGDDARYQAEQADSQAEEARAQAQSLQAQLQQALREAQATMSALGVATMAIEEDRQGIVENRNTLQQSRGGVQIDEGRRGMDDAIRAADQDAHRREQQSIELRKAMAELARASGLPQVGGLSEARRASSSNFRLSGAGNVSSADIASGMYQAATRAGGNRSGQERPRTSTLPPERVVRDALAAARDPRMGRVARVDRTQMSAGARTGIKAQRWSLADPTSYARVHQALTGGLDEWK